MEKYEEDKIELIQSLTKKYSELRAEIPNDLSDSEAIENSIYRKCFAINLLLQFMTASKSLEETTMAAYYADDDLDKFLDRIDVDFQKLPNGESTYKLNFQTNDTES